MCRVGKNEENKRSQENRKGDGATSTGLGISEDFIFGILLAIKGTSNKESKLQNNISLNALYLSFLVKTEQEIYVFFAQRHL